MASYIEPFATDRAGEIAELILEHFGSLDQALRTHAGQLTAALGEANADVAHYLLASRRLVLAALSEEVRRSRVDVDDPVFRHYVVAKFRGLAFEELHAIFLDHDQGFIREDLVSIGDDTRVETRLACLFRRAIEVDARGMVLMHNHPSHTPYPSVEDVRATRRIMQLASALDLCVVDHLIIAGGQIVSMKSEGLL